MKEREHLEEVGVEEKDNIKINPKGLGLKIVDWINVT